MHIAGGGGLAATVLFRSVEAVTRLPIVRLVLQWKLGMSSPFTDCSLHGMIPGIIHRSSQGGINSILSTLKEFTKAV